MGNRSGLAQTQDQAKTGTIRTNPDLLEWVGGWVAKPFPFAA